MKYTRSDILLDNLRQNIQIGRELRFQLIANKILIVLQLILMGILIYSLCSCTSLREAQIEHDNYYLYTSHIVVTGKYKRTDTVTDGLKRYIIMDYRNQAQVNDTLDLRDPANDWCFNVKKFLK
jgi:hypothetical protein